MSKKLSENNENIIDWGYRPNFQSNLNRNFCRIRHATTEVLSKISIFKDGLHGQSSVAVIAFDFQK